MIKEQNNTEINKKHATNNIKIITPRNDDIFLVSYPKSGNTWVRFLIGNLIETSEKITFSNIETIVPDLHKNTSEELDNLKSPRIIKSHELYNSTFKRVIYIVRDPRSVSVSFYHHLIKFFIIPEKYPFEKFVDNLPKGKYMNYFGSWDSHVLGWIDGAKKSEIDFLLLRYEDLNNNLEEKLIQVANFLGHKIDQKGCQQVIYNSSFNEMKKLETLDWKSSKLLGHGDPNKPFIRSGQIDEWKKYFNQKTETKLLAKFNFVMKQVRYIE